MITYKVPFMDQNDINENSIPTLPENYEEYNNLLKKLFSSFAF